MQIVTSTRVSHVIIVAVLTVVKPLKMTDVIIFALIRYVFQTDSCMDYTLMKSDLEAM